MFLLVPRGPKRPIDPGCPSDILGEQLTARHDRVGDLETPMSIWTDVFPAICAIASLIFVLWTAEPRAFQHSVRHGCIDPLTVRDRQQVLSEGQRAATGFSGQIRSMSSPIQRCLAERDWFIDATVYLHSLLPNLVSLSRFQWELKCRVPTHTVVISIKQPKDRCTGRSHVYTRQD